MQREYEVHWCTVCYRMSSGFPWHVRMRFLWGQWVNSMQWKMELERTRWPPMVLHFHRLPQTLCLPKNALLYVHFHRQWYKQSWWFVFESKQLGQPQSPKTLRSAIASQSTNVMRTWFICTSSIVHSASVWACLALSSWPTVTGRKECESSLLCIFGISISESLTEEIETYPGTSWCAETTRRRTLNISASSLSLSLVIIIG